MFKYKINSEFFDNRTNSNLEEGIQEYSPKKQKTQNTTTRSFFRRTNTNLEKFLKTSISDFPHDEEKYYKRNQNYLNEMDNFFIKKDMLSRLFPKKLG